MASMDGQTASTSTGSSEGDKSDLYSSLDKLELFNCGKCSKTFRKQRHCEAHMREAHSNNTKVCNKRFYTHIFPLGFLYS